MSLVAMVVERIQGSIGKERSKKTRQILQRNGAGLKCTGIWKEEEGEERSNGSKFPASLLPSDL